VGDAASADEPKKRLIDVLRSCPLKDFFTPMERLETTDDLKPAKRNARFIAEREV
jgi:hypothetical protein